MISITIWTIQGAQEGCALSTEGEFNSVILHIEGGETEFELVMDSSDARKFIFQVHRAILDSLQDGPASSPNSGIGGSR